MIRLSDLSLEDTLNTIKLIVFDVDGTLVISKADWDGMREKIHEYFESNFGINLEFKPVLQKIDEAISLMQKKDPSANIKNAREVALKIIEETGLEGLKKSYLIENGIEILEKLKRRIKLAAFTRSGRTEASLALRLHKLEKYFDIVMTRDDSEKVKPDPEPILIISKKLKVKPKDILVIGDHPYDILAGKRAGAKTMGVLSGLAPSEDLKNAGADFILNSVSDIENYL